MRKNILFEILKQLKKQYDVQLHSDELKNPEEMYYLLEKYKLPKLIWEENTNLKTFITTEEI